MYYLLDDDKNPVKVSLMEWTKWFNIVKQDNIDGKHICTVFIGIDHNFSPLESRIPILFETMVFTIDDDPDVMYDIEDYRERYATYDQALKGHEEAIEWVKRGCKDE